MNPLLRRSAAHVFVESLDAPTLSDVDEHHLRVLRVRPFDAITVTDGEGAWQPATWSPTAGVTFTGPVSRAEPTEPRSVASGIPKGDRAEWMVQKLVELGVDRVVLFTATRSVVRWDAARAPRQLDRLRRVAREAAMQSRRVRLASVDLLTWDEVLALPGLAAADPDGGAFDADVRTVAVGPEGGFTDDELAGAGRRVALGSLVLRVETAAIAAAVHLAEHRTASSP